jgi:hypothetical protein
MKHTRASESTLKRSDVPNNRVAVASEIQLLTVLGTTDVRSKIQSPRRPRSTSTALKSQVDRRRTEKILRENRTRTQIPSALRATPGFLHSSFRRVLGDLEVYVFHRLPLDYSTWAHCPEFERAVSQSGSSRSSRMSSADRIVPYCRKVLFRPNPDRS